MPVVAASRHRWSLAPDGHPRPDAPFGRGPLAARVLGRVIDGAAHVGSRVPTSVTSPLAVVGGTAEWALRGTKRRRLAENLGHAIGAPQRSGEVRHLVRAEVVNESRRSADLLWAMGKPEEFLATVDVVGAEHPHAALARGHGVVLAGIHLGGWEVAAAVPAAILPTRTSVIVADNWLAWAIQHVRVAAGLGVVYRSASPLHALRLLSRGEALLIFGDDASGAPPRLHVVPFCDAYAGLPAGVVSLARMSGAPIVPYFVIPLCPRRWRVVIEPAIDPPARRGGEAAEREVLAALAGRWTLAIRAQPDQWAASFPIAWRSTP